MEVLINPLILLISRKEENLDSLQFAAKMTFLKQTEILLWLW